MGSAQLTKTNSNDFELLQRVMKRDSKALEALYDKYSPLLFTLIRRIVKDDKLAEEVLADVFVIIWQKTNLYNFDYKNVFTWIVLLTKNKAVDTLRRRNGFAKVEYSDEYENNFIIPTVYDYNEFGFEEALNKSEQLKSAISKLTEAQRYVLQLAFFEGMTQSEIAAKLKIPLPTVKSKLTVALNSLKEKMNSEEV
ncbi:ECF subfamily RNA polymerase sigma-70 factor [Ignavibacterium album JCM 16511]|uniref:ECF subfamily RNA polymerase sigma-70 factor n=1 Tax=Ignavibacterium album (strain DSM 19864 / JCM 16511 / NBRC 101810 / Mat9-16) TaxID=945713 RepID=I0AG13_IGNAJ|nr:sigma-70 family RNA polymerase sigma factor [Ignavibacterium album]AFH47920.1 ECF subfamily RNA polymerase sigma-70 factor [Ignavibacterium album JCM 16511]